jgi:hypothetical protein
MRGYSTRVAVYFRYAAYFLAVVVCSAISHAAFQTTTTWQAGGKMMFFSAALMTVTAALGTVMFTNYRNEIIRQFRHFVFGIAVFPGTGIALFLWAINTMLDSPTSNNDAFAAMLHNAVPIVYFCTVGIPALVFVKAVAGMRTINRSRLDDEETMRVYTRQDGLMR